MLPMKEKNTINKSEYQRINKLLKNLTIELLKKHTSLEDLAKALDLSLTEVRYEGIESLYYYCNLLEKENAQLANDKKMYEIKLNQIIANLESSTDQIIKMSRDVRNSSDTF